jgi:hypothetical protein
MIPVSDAATANNVARLAASPPNKGTYVPAKQLTEQQKAAAAHG